MKNEKDERSGSLKGIVVIVPSFRVDRAGTHTA